VAERDSLLKVANGTPVRIAERIAYTTKNIPMGFVAATCHPHYKMQQLKGKACYGFTTPSDQCNQKKPATLTTLT
jgi:hypothetical protein